MRSRYRVAVRRYGGTVVSFFQEQFLRDAWGWSSEVIHRRRAGAPVKELDSLFCYRVRGLKATILSKVYIESAFAIPRFYVPKTPTGCVRVSPRVRSRCPGGERLGCLAEAFPIPAFISVPVSPSRLGLARIRDVARALRSKPFEVSRPCHCLPGRPWRSQFPERAVSVRVPTAVSVRRLSHWPSRIRHRSPVAIRGIGNATQPTRGNGNAFEAHSRGNGNGFTLLSDSKRPACCISKEALWSRPSRVRRFPNWHPEAGK